VKGAELKESPPEELPAPATGPEDLEPSTLASLPPTRAAWGRVAGAATLVLLVAISIVVFIILIR
jgi:hypothetical protein